MRGALRYAALGAAAAAAGCASPDRLEPRIGAERAWSVVEGRDGGGRVCWIASRPLSAATLGAPEGARGTPFLMAAFHPDAGSAAEISYVAGWPIERGGAEISVGGATYALYAEGRTAWIADPVREIDLINDLRAGREAQARSASAEGEGIATDTFSLMGFTAALEEARRRCA